MDLQRSVAISSEPGGIQVQFNHNRRQIAAILALIAAPALAGQQQGCAPDPLSIMIPKLTITDEPPLAQLLKVAFEKNICLGIAYQGKLSPSRPSTMENAPFNDVIRVLLPDFRVRTAGSVVDILRGMLQPTWLDYKLRRFQTLNASLEFNSLQLFFFARDQVYHPKEGYAGSLSESVRQNKVGPFTVHERSIFETLNMLVGGSSQGGAWVVNRRYRQSDAFPADKPFWTIIPYGGSLQDALSRLTP